MTRTACVAFDNPDKTRELSLCPGKNLNIDFAAFKTICGDMTSLEEDLLLVAAAVYACDLAFKRGLRENFNRLIKLTIPVVNLQAFERTKAHLRKTLYTLSGDCWQIDFVAKDGIPEPVKDWPTQDGKSLLFSGGLDSFAAAVDLLNSSAPDSILLASHQTSNPVVMLSQQKIFDHLTQFYGGKPKRLVVRISAKAAAEWDFPKKHEETQRTRSFMFSAIAALGARRLGLQEVVIIGENGQMAIHLPLSMARIGAFSTHTAHPEFVSSVESFFTDLLHCDFKFSNPFLYMTKAAVVRLLLPDHKDAIEHSVSCWRRVTSNLNHCGGCIPCLIRRIALEYNGVRLPEYQIDAFATDLLAAPADNETKRNAMDLFEQVHMFKTLTNAQLFDAIADLYSSYFDSNKAIDMYRNFALEADTVLLKYPSMKAALNL